MRVIAGQFRGRVLAAPESAATRPTTDRVREAVFSSLYSRLGGFDGARVLDAFAGSGALGIEALSRGARSCCFFENDPAVATTLSGNISSCGIEARRARVLVADVLAQSWPARQAPGPFELVLLDPPYALSASDVCGLLERMAAAGCLADGAVVYYEHAYVKGDERAALFEHGGLFTCTGQKKYGKIAATYLRCECGGEQGRGL